MWVSLLACLIYTIFTYLNNVDAPLPILLWRKWHGAQRSSNVLPDVIHRSKGLVWSLRRPPFEERKREAVSTVLGVRTSHTPSIAFRHLPPNSARFSYATEGALFISAQLSTDAVSALRKVWVLIRLWKQRSAQART